MYTSLTNLQEVDDTSKRAQAATSRRHWLAGLSLAVALISFTVQTESASRMAAQGYQKPFFMLYATHSSWILLYPAEVTLEWLAKRNMPFKPFLKRHLNQQYRLAEQIAHINGWEGTTIAYFRRTCLKLAVILNTAASSWYVAVNWTTPGDLTAIYNASALFVYAFGIPILKEAWNPTKGFAVVLSIFGVLIVAYGGGSTTGTGPQKYPKRLLGNVVIGAGAVLYGLYEVLYKKIACPPQSTSAKKQAVFSVVVGSLLACTNILILWPLLVVLDITGIEPFELPHGHVAVLVTISVISNMIFSGSFLMLMSLTSPLLGSVASLLTTFLVPLVDYLFFGTTIGFWGVVGGLVIIAAFGVMSWASWVEMQEDGNDDDD